VISQHHEGCTHGLPTDRDRSHTPAERQRRARARRRYVAAGLSGLPGSFLVSRGKDAEQLAHRVVDAYFRVTGPDAIIRHVMASVPPERASQIAQCFQRRTKTKALRASAPGAHHARSQRDQTSSVIPKLSLIGTA
jgi:hypothetical protein